MNGTARTVDNTRFCFFKFASNYGWTAADCCGQHSPPSADAKAHYHERVNMLKHGQIFWDKRRLLFCLFLTETCEFGLPKYPGVNDFLAHRKRFISYRFLKIMKVSIRPEHSSF